MLRCYLTAANQMCERLPSIISQFSSSSEHGFALSYIDHFPFLFKWSGTQAIFFSLLHQSSENKQRRKEKCNEQ